MPSGLVLYGYHYSVYVRIVRMTLLEKRLDWRHIEIDPFSDLPPSYLDLNPFGRVPTLVDEDFVLYETTAITRYLDDRFASPRLQPVDPRHLARMNQLISIADSYAYRPLVRSVFSHAVFRPAAGETSDPSVVEAGLRDAATVLAAVEHLVGDELFLAGEEISLADLHWGAMLDYFSKAPEGAMSLSQYPKLSRWWAGFSQRQSMVNSDPGLPAAA